MDLLMQFCTIHKTSWIIKTQGHMVCLKSAEFFQFQPGLVNSRSNWWPKLVYVLSHRVTGLIGQTGPGQAEFNNTD